jgi:hypothetical protein
MFDLNFLDGVWMDNCAIGFPNSFEIFFWIEPCPEGVALASGRLHFSCTQFLYQGFEHPDHEGWRPDGWTNACNFHIWSLSVRTMKTDVWTVELCMHDLPYEGECLDGNTHYLDGCSCLLIFVFWKEIFQPVKHWKASGRVAEMSRRMQARTVQRFSTQRKV